MTIHCGLVFMYRVDCAERGTFKLTANDARDFDRELLVRRKAVDAGSDQTFDGIGQFDQLQVTPAAPLCAVALYDQQAIITQSQRNFFGIHRHTFGTFDD